jgi:Uncharacterized conserved protein (DUF2249)
MSERVLDVSPLEPPAPRDRVVAALESLADGEYLRVHHRREPLLLYPWLQEHGFAWHTQAGDVTAFEIIIWRADDAQATAAAGRVLKP